MGSGAPRTVLCYHCRRRFEVGGKKIELPVMGVFEITDGKIAAWRDYFDMAADSLRNQPV